MVFSNGKKGAIFQRFRSKCCSYGKKSSAACRTAAGACCSDGEVELLDLASVPSVLDVDRPSHISELIKVVKLFK